MEMIFEDSFNLLCGRLLGEGAFRKVYQCKLVPDLVVKVEKEPHDRTFANVFEYNFWSEYQDVKGVGEYLAPCEGMSPNGLLLLQRKCKPVNTDKLPKRLPEFLTDLKPEN